MAAESTGVAVRTESATTPSTQETLTPTEPVDRGPSRGAVEAALARVLSSDPVRASRRSADFLAFAVGEVLAGRGDGLKERAIAVRALGRGARFDPRVDPSVRVQARRVRAALERYYAGPGASDPLRIDLPRGGYAPVFRPNRGHALADPPSSARGALVVVSLTNLTPGGDHDHLAQGLSETLVAVLSRCPDCRVVGPVGRGLPDLGAPPSGQPAQRFLMGSVRERGGALRASLRVVEAEGGETTWSRIFDRRLDAPDPFAIEDDIVAEVAAALCGHDRFVSVGVTVALPGDT